MLIVDRYVLRQFLWNFVWCFIALTGLFVVFDAFGNLDEFQRFAQKHGNLWGTMAEFYFHRSIYFFDRVSGVLAMIAAMFTVTWIQRHNELTALMAAGISRLRVIVPVIAAAGAIGLLASANRELVIPRMRDALARNPKDLSGESAQPFKQRFDNATGILFQGLQTYAVDQRIEKPEFVLPQALDKHGKRLSAANAYYSAPRDGRPGGYSMRGVTQPAALLQGKSLMLADRAIVITPPDAPDWLAADECFVVSEVNFEQLRGGQAWRQFSSTPELVAGLSNRALGFGADVRVAIHSRLLQPLLDMTLLFLGLPLMLGRENRNIFVAIGACAGVTTAFMLVVMAAQYLGGVYYIDPAKAAWAPLALFIPIATAMFDRLRR